MECKNVNAAAMRQLPRTSASAEVKGMAELSGLIPCFQAHKTLTYAQYSKMTSCTVIAVQYENIKATVGTSEK